ncbi:MAG: hypothetical protein LUI07_04435, partial [Lachnospiraceae bacterium]|nr:hypothetical protein [Lachnospiraceae bacterium]
IPMAIRILTAVTGGSAMAIPGPTMTVILTGNPNIGEMAPAMTIPAVLTPTGKEDLSDGKA